ncbi:MAG: dienelactone hydrolase family protein [Anaerolineae bacterium]
MLRFYETMACFAERFDAVSRRLGFRATSIEEWRFWRQALEATVRRLTGYERLLPVPLNARLTEEVQRDGYRRQRVEIDTEPGVTMPLYVLLPDGPAGKAPAVIAAHGHGSGGKYSPAGCVEVPGIEAQVRDYNYDYGVQAARRGYVVFCPDARGFGERRESNYQSDDMLLSSSCSQLAHMGLPLGLTVAGMWAWDLSRLIDYALTRPEVEAPRIGCIGLSGGGLQALYLAAMDERVQCAVISGYFYGVRESLLVLSGNCDCNYVPQLWENADMGDLAALIAPRPLLIETGNHDPLNGASGVANVLRQYEITKSAYDLLGVPERIDHDVFEGAHLWHGTVAYEWLDRWLKQPLP